MNSIFLYILFIMINENSAVKCYTDQCDPEDFSCLVTGDKCHGRFCFLDITGDQKSYKKINRGCLDRQFLPDESDGCYVLNADTRRYFCQCVSELCNAKVTNLKLMGDRNISCDTGCSRSGPRQRQSRLRTSTQKSGMGGRHEMICKGKTIGAPFCSYDPQNRGNPQPEFGESYYTPFGSFFGWPDANSTVCIRYTFPPFYFIRDASCFCDTDNCNRLIRNQIDQGPLVMCHGCFMDCNGVGEFCGPLDQVCQNDTTCTGHYCVTHAVTDHFTEDGGERLAVLSQYCMNSTRKLNGTNQQMIFKSGRNGQTLVRICQEDYCNAFNTSSLSIGLQPHFDNSTEDENSTISGFVHPFSTPNTGRMVKLRKLLNLLLESFLSPKLSS